MFISVHLRARCTYFVAVVVVVCAPYCPSCVACLLAFLLLFSVHLSPALQCLSPRVGGLLLLSAGVVGKGTADAR